MNRRLLILSFLFVNLAASAQSYLRGEVRDEQNNPLPNAKILLHSTGYVYHSGNSGSFGIITPGQTDSITISLTGYQTLSLKVDASQYLSLNLRLLRSTVNMQKNRLLSFTRNLAPSASTDWTLFGESYSSLVENGFVEAKGYPETGFAIRTDKASYSNIRRFLNMDMKVPPDAVRIEELMNYFDFGYLPPLPDSVFSFSSRLSDCPWNPAAKLLFMRICAKKLEPEQIPPSNLVFLIDISGSMDMPNRLPLLKSAFKLLIDNLREKDTISIVVYGSAVGVFLPPTSGKDKVKIRRAIEDLRPGGATPGESGILSAYQLAKSQFIRGGNNRVILATDGDFNVGQHSDDQLEQLITSHQQTGIYLTCLGVGMGNYKDSKLEVLAKKGNGNFAYLDNEEEAEKVLVKELTQTLYSVADDALLNIRFNNERVKQYRLIGYDNKVRALTDSLTDIEGGEVGSGHSAMVLFEIVPSGLSPLYNAGLPDLARIEVRYRLPADSVQRVSAFRVPDNYVPFASLDSNYRFATSVAMFGSLLKGSPYTRKVTWNEVVNTAESSYDSNDPVQQQFLGIIGKARKMYLKKQRWKMFN